MSKEKQELHCHGCNNYVRFDLNLSIDDNYILTCPKCGHKHYRAVKNGKITDERWGQDPSQRSNAYYGGTHYSNVTVTSTSTTSLNDLSGSTGGSFWVSSWASTGTSCC